MKKKYRQSQAGFTLLETITSLFIVMLLTALFVANYSSGSNGAEVKMVAQNIASYIRLAQNYCLGATNYHGLQPAGGWGVYVNAYYGGFAIFADLNNNGVIDHPAETYRVAVLPPPFRLLNLSNGSYETYIMFLPPDPETSIDGGARSEISISVQDRRNGETWRIIVNKTGMIEIKR